MTQLSAFQKLTCLQLLVSTLAVFASIYVNAAVLTRYDACAKVYVPTRTQTGVVLVEKIMCPK